MGQEIIDPRLFRVRPSIAEDIAQRHLWIGDRRESVWLSDPMTSAYVRWTYRAIEGLGVVRTYELANISSYDQEMPCKWLVVLRALEELGGVVYVENVLEDRLCPLLSRMGYTCVGYELNPSYWKDFRGEGKGVAVGSSDILG